MSRTSWRAANPKASSRIVNGRAFSSTGEGFTEQFQKGAEISLELAQDFGCTNAILKSSSPSCGYGEIYNGKFKGEKCAGDGITAKLFHDNKIDIEVI